MERSRMPIPEGGWLTLALVLLLGLILGTTVDQAAWILGRTSLTDFLPAAVIGGLLVGVAGGLFGWGRWRTHLVGAVVAALVLPVVIGMVLLPQGGDIGAYYRATAEAAVAAFRDLVVLGRGSTTRYGHFMLALGILMWATGQFAAYAIYGHRRPLAGVAALSIAMLVNVSLTIEDQFVYLILFSFVGLLLLVRLHVFDERRDWVRRHVGDPGPLAAMTLRGGTVFVVVAVIGSYSLTTVARSAPLQGAWRGAQPWLVSVGQDLGQYFPFLSSTKGPSGVTFGPSVHIGTRWRSGPGIAATISRSPGDSTRYYWRAATYDVFTGQGWETSSLTSDGMPANASLLDGSEEATPTASRTAVTVTVHEQGYTGSEILSPGAPAAIDLGSTVNLIGTGGAVASVQVGSGADTYTVTGLYKKDATPGETPEPGAITINRLRVAGTDYPLDVTAHYLGTGPAGTIGPAAESLLQQVVANAAGPDPYDIAVEMQRTLTSDPFKYSGDISDVPCGPRSVVECFAVFHRGFCMYFASTMAVLLRADDIPTRLVQGFLPGTISGPGGETEIVPLNSAHAWVEVYFPGYGWYPFDPTRTLGQLVAPPTGPPVATPSPTPTGSSGGEDVAGPSRDRQSIGPGGADTTPGTGGGQVGSGPFIVIAIVLLGVFGWLAFASYRRGPRDVDAEGAWRSVTGIARRLGFGPRPTQTVYEYTASLGEELPGVRPELETVARAKVEVAYGRQLLGPDRLRAIRAATGRLRVGLLRLLLRRSRRRR